MSLQTGTLEITGLRVETLAALDAKARESGKTVEEYARELIEEVAAPEMTLDEVLAPIRRQVAESGISDEELDELFMQARREYHRKQKGAAREQAIADWRARAEALAKDVAAAWNSEQTAVETLAEMRR